MSSRFSASLAAIFWWAALFCAKSFDYYGNISDTSRPVAVLETDGSSFTLKRLPQDPTIFASCYEIQHGNVKKQFCYPSINIVGYAKCGTSAMYVFLTKHRNFIRAHPRLKEYCPTPTNSSLPFSLFTYLSGFPTMRDHQGGTLSVNGCINSDNQYLKLQKMLAPQQTASILLVRSLPERMWAAYNYWCSNFLDVECTNQVKTGVYRSPKMFSEMMKASNYVDEREDPLAPSCNTMSTLYSTVHSRFIRALGEESAPLLVASESLLDGGDKLTTLRRLERFINSKLNSKITLVHNHLHKVNTGNRHGPELVNDKSQPEGLYLISRNQPMMASTEVYIHRCWKECRNIADLTEHNYNCEVDF